ncbi:MAG: hypothetical protein J0L92_17000 [Deltaproteobacteria bacterium]|nr:hypothetical protein [Deltaproteobacteria bacterium]
MSGARAGLLATVASLVCLAVAAFLFVDTTRARRDAGFWHVVSYDADCARDPAWRDGPRTLVAEPFHGELLERHVPPASARCDLYRGYLVVREPSRLSLELHASGSARIVMGKQELLALDAGGVRITRRVERPLAAGSHLVEVRTEQSGQLAYLRLSARIERDDDATEAPLAARALTPFDHDLLAPSLVDGERVREDATFARRTPRRLALFLLVVLAAIVAPGLGRSIGALRAGWTAMDARMCVLATIALLATIEAIGGSSDHVAIDPHFITHGARAWRTLWLSVPTGTAADSIPALGPTEWALGAAHALGGEGGPRVWAVAVSAIVIAALVASARLIGGVRAALITMVCFVALHVLLDARALGRAEMGQLGVACLCAMVTWTLTRARVASRLSRIGVGTSPEDPSSHRRATSPRLTRVWTGVMIVACGIAIALGLAPTLLGPIVILVAIVSVVAARDAWLGRV